MLTSALWSDDVIVWEYIGKWRLTSRNDVMTSEFHQNHRKCLYYQYLTCVQIWTHLDNFEIRNIHFCDFGYNMENPIHFLPTSDKCGIKSFLCMHSCQFFQKTSIHMIWGPVTVIHIYQLNKLNWHEIKFSFFGQKWLSVRLYFSSLCRLWLNNNKSTIRFL